MTALDLHCPDCGAPPRSCCMNPLGQLVAIHPARAAALRPFAIVPVQTRRPKMTPEQRRQAHAERSRRNRAMRTAEGKCINHSTRPATHGVRCESCDATHKRTRQSRKEAA